MLLAKKSILLKIRCLPMLLSRIGLASYLLTISGLHLDSFLIFEFIFTDEAS